MRIGLVVFNVALLAAILVFVLQNPHTTGEAASSLFNSKSSQSTVAANPLDQVSSADIALTVARLGSLPEATAISNQAQSQAADMAIAGATDTVVSKPQVVATALKSRADIQLYVAEAGDTISSLARKFGVTSDSIRWSNSIAGDTIIPGTKLHIPPVNGIVYTVKAGDTADSLAAKFNANKSQIIAYNDGELGGLHPGELIIIPNGAPSTATSISSVSSFSAFPWGSGPLYGYNGYDYGYCTWYVATQISVPANWGNASTWAYYARLSGWNVSQTPAVGDIAQIGSRAAGGLGHVAIVTAVLPDGSVEYRDMNGIAGWGNVGTATVPASHFDNYISR